MSAIVAVLFNFVHFINNEPRIKITTLDGPQVGEREREREREERWDVIGQLSLSRDRCLPLTPGPHHHPSIGCLFLEEKTVNSAAAAASDAPDTHLFVSEVDACDNYKACFITDFATSL